MTHLQGLPCTAAVQREKGSGVQINGELFGIQNLLKLSAERVETLEIVRPQRAEASYRMEQYNPDDLGKPALQPCQYLYKTSMHPACRRRL